MKMNKIITSAFFVLILGLITITNPNYLSSKVQAQQVTDPLQDLYTRYKPTMIPPTISVTSPQNYSTINTNSIFLVFNVSKTQVTEIAPNVNKYSSNLIKVYYKADWQIEEQNLYFNEYENLEFMEFNTTLSNIPEGTHELQIFAVGDVSFTVAMFGFSYRPDTNTSIIFTINSMQPTPSPEPISEIEPFPTTLVIASVAVVAVVGFGILAYFKKRKRKS